MAKKVPEIPNASMADIAFMILIFFLITTTMDTDTGLERVLPPPADPNQTQDVTTSVKERNIFVVLVNAQDQILCENEFINVKDIREKAKEFLANPANAENLPEKEIKEVPLFGQVEICKNAVISLRNDFGTTYGTYLMVQNELVAAVNDLRNELSMEKWGKKYADLNKDQQDAVKMIYPQKISEAEPKQVGVKKQ